MTDPVAFELFGRPIYWYGVFFALGFMAAVTHWTLLGKRSAARGRYPTHAKPAELASDMALWLMIGGVLGARLAYIITFRDQFAEQPMSVFRIDQGGLIYYGGFLGTILAAVLYARWKKEPVWALGDFIITAGPLGHAFGRVGCYINGCCYGKDVIGGGFFTVKYPQFEQPVYATQMFEVVTNVAIFALLLWGYQRKRLNGRVVALYLLVYPVTRFINERYRADEPAFGTSLSAAQYLSMLLFAAGLVIWFAAPRFRENRLDAG